MLRYIDKCLHSPQQIDRKIYGAGLGIYLIANAATQFVLNVAPGMATEVVCTFDRKTARASLRALSVFVYPGRPGRSSRPRSSAAGRRGDVASGALGGVSAAVAARRRRHGRDLRRQDRGRRRLREAGRAQGHPSELLRRSRVRADARRRGEARGAAAARQHRADLRPRPRRRAVLHRDGADRRRRSLQAPAPRRRSTSIDFPFEVAAFIAQEVAPGSTTRTASATRRGRPLEIVHRDVSPQNVLRQLRRRGEDRRLRHRQGGAARRSRPPPASSRASTTT